MKKRVLIAHPSKQHSFQLALALKRKGILFRYITSVYDKEGSYTAKFKLFLKGDNLKKASTRRCEGLLDIDVIQYCEILGLILLFISRIPFLKKHLYFKIFAIRRKKFGKKVAEFSIRNDVDAVVMYDSTAIECFAILKVKAPHIKRILDVSIASRLFLKNSFEIDMSNTGSSNLRIEEKELWNMKNLGKFKQEILDSNYYLVPSEIVKKSIGFSGGNMNNTVIVPYGVDVSKFNFVEKKNTLNPLKLIYVGQVSYRKGIHHLLEVISQFHENEVELNILGGYDSKGDLFKFGKTLPHVNFLGFVTRDKLAYEYQKSDVFVFPTLGEGYGLVILEAFSCGVPVISSNLAGGNDAIRDHLNGIVFEAGVDIDLRNSIQWFIDNKDKLPEMSKNARDTATQLTWENYYEKAYSAVCSMLD